MSDEQTTINELKKVITQFIRERDWEQFHSIKNVCMDLSVEASELMEIFTWADDQRAKHLLNTKREEVEDEAADVLFALLNFCNICSIDLVKAFENKMKKNIAKYPVEKAKGKALKYNEL